MKKIKNWTQEHTKTCHSIIIHIDADIDAADAAAAEDDHAVLLMLFVLL